MMNLFPQIKKYCGNTTGSFLNTPIFVILYLLYSDNRFNSIKNHVYKEDGMIYLYYHQYNSIEDFNKMSKKDKIEENIIFYKFLNNNGNKNQTKRVMNLLNQYQGNKDLMDIKLDHSNFAYYIRFNENISNIFINYFERIIKNNGRYNNPNNEIRTSMDDENDNNENENNENINKENINSIIKNNIVTVTDYFIDKKFKTLQEAKDIYKNKCIYIPNRFKEDPQCILNNYYNYYIPKIAFSMMDFHKLINSNDDCRFIMNPEIKISTFDYNALGMVQNVQFRIDEIIEINESSGEKFVAMYKYICPRKECHESVQILPEDIHQELLHGCKNYITEDNRQKFTKIKPSALKNDKMKYIYLYKCKIKIAENKGKKNWKEIYIYSFNNDMKIGRYYGNIIVFDDKLNKDESKNRTLVFLLGYNMIKPDANIEMINNETVQSASKSFCEKIGMPHIRLIDTVFGVRYVYKKFTNFDFEDKGMWLQIITTISELARNLFEHEKFGINVISNMSLGKTFIATKFAQMLDLKFKHSPDISSNMSEKGFTGGINNNGMNINGVNIKTFQKGIVSFGGTIVMDEATKFFTDSNYNMALKGFFNKNIDIAKIGGKTLEVDYTPIMLSNFDRIDKEYRNDIYKYYKTKCFKNNEEEINIHENSNTEILRYLNKIDLYLPISYYQNSPIENKILAESVYYVRNVWTKNKKLDYKNGGLIEAMNRIFFNVSVWNTLNVKKKKFKSAHNMLCDIEDEILPINEFIDQIHEYYNPENKNIQLFYEYKMSGSKEEKQIKKLYSSIEKWLEGKDCENMIEFITNSTYEIDPKTESLLHSMIAVIQLCEDINSTEISENVKKWVVLLVLKNNRGISEREYNFEKNLMHIDVVNYDVIELEEELKEITEENKINEKARIELQKEKIQKKEENINNPNENELNENKDMSIEINNINEKEFNEIE